MRLRGVLSHSSYGIFVPKWNTPAEAGVRGTVHLLVCQSVGVSIGPPPKRGCEALQIARRLQVLQGLNRAPAEAGVRGGLLHRRCGDWAVSIGPPPKRGCERE